jgi:hypothetical protein
MPFQRCLPVCYTYVMQSAEGGKWYTNRLERH